MAGDGGKSASEDAYDEEETGSRKERRRPNVSAFG